jgi:hypothetical protein
VLLLVIKIISFQGCIWPVGRVSITHEPQTIILETKALFMGYFRSIAAIGIIMAKPQEQLIPVTYLAMVSHDSRRDSTGPIWLFLTRHRISVKEMSLKDPSES